MEKCKHENRDGNYVVCGRDGSRRKLGKGCPCGHFEDTAFTRFKKWLSRIFK